MSTEKTGMVKGSFDKLNALALKIDQPKSALGVITKYAIIGAVGYGTVELVKKGAKKVGEMRSRRKAA